MSPSSEKGLKTFCEQPHLQKADSSIFGVLARGLGNSSCGDKVTLQIIIMNIIKYVCNEKQMHFMKGLLDYLQE